MSSVNARHVLLAGSGDAGPEQRASAGARTERPTMVRPGPNLRGKTRNLRDTREQDEHACDTSRACAFSGRSSCYVQVPSVLERWKVRNLASF